MMDRRTENKMYIWERERTHGQWVYALVNSALTVITLYVIFGALNFGKIINIPFLTFKSSYPFLIPAFVLLYVAFLFYYSHREEEYQQLLKHKKSEIDSYENKRNSIE